MVELIGLTTRITEQLNAPENRNLIKHNKKMKKILLSTILAGCFAHAANAAVTINLTAASFKTATGVNITTDGVLFQLLNLGADGQFNPIDVADPTNAGDDRWVSGDDSLITSGFGAPDFSSAKAFDRHIGSDSQADSGVAPGGINRAFVSIDIPTNAKVGIRWFPTLLATNYASITLASGTPYGQFTRQSPTPKGAGGGDYWQVLAQGATYTFDALFTTDAGGTDPNSAGNASFVVVPEPGSIVLSLLGAVGLAAMRRRRA